MTQDEKQTLRDAQNILDKEMDKHSSSESIWEHLWDACKTIQQVLEDNGEPISWHYVDG